jgi:2-oxoglutarate ferredoxin oxidoreductase subunit gamma
VLNVPANDIAVSLGNARAANMVALGAIVKATDVVSLELLKATMARVLGHKEGSKLIAVNEQALEAGYSAV